ncbi:hypothetical protein VKT23_005321 [Stygiomarasmius scandens]|uniref:Uncharacterized protein n=1 Tax=Marasmiellus scandens TaxID=2682957 RepID=A0ABR1JPX8_9AGAR
MSYIATPTLPCKRSVHFPEVLFKSAAERPRKSSIVYPRLAQNRALPSDRNTHDLQWRLGRLSAASLPDNVYQQEQVDATTETSAAAVAQSPEIPSTPYASPRISSSFTSPRLGPRPLSQFLANINKSIYCSPPLLKPAKLAPPPVTPGYIGTSTDSLTDGSYSSFDSSSGSESD